MGHWKLVVEWVEWRCDSDLAELDSLIVDRTIVPVFPGPQEGEVSPICVVLHARSEEEGALGVTLLLFRAVEVDFPGIASEYNDLTNSQSEIPTVFGRC